LRELHCRACQRLHLQSCSNGHGLLGSQDRPNHSGGARAEEHKRSFGPKFSCEEGLPRLARRIQGSRHQGQPRPQIGTRAHQLPQGQR
jgi:hypothetical protein